MIDDPKGIEADGRHDELVAIYRREVPALFVLLRSLAQGTGLTASDIDDIVQETFLRVLGVLARPGSRPDYPRAYLYRVATNCLIEHSRRARRQPRQLTAGDGGIADPNPPSPEETGEGPGGTGPSEWRREEMQQWASRFLASLSELGHQLGELDRLKEGWPASDGGRTQRPARGRPTKPQQVRRIIRDLPGQVALVREYLQGL